MYKILFTDIDGTLLNKSREITPATKREIQRISLRLNIPVVLISSRMPKAIKHLHEELSLMSPVIAYNGALILKATDIKNESDIFFSTAIKADTVRSILDFKADCDFHVSLYYNDDWYVEGLDYWANREITSTKVKPYISSHELVIKDWEEKQAGAHKVMCMGDANEIQKLYEWLENNFTDEINLYRSKPTYIEITPGNVSKATAVNLILDHLNIPSSESMAVGDNYNDIEMLQNAGAGIAMGNAPDEVKAVSDFVTLPNYEDGLAGAIKKYF